MEPSIHEAHTGTAPHRTGARHDFPRCREPQIPICGRPFWRSQGAGGPEVGGRGSGVAWEDGEICRLGDHLGRPSKGEGPLVLSSTSRVVVVVDVEPRHRWYVCLIYSSRASLYQACQLDPNAPFLPSRPVRAAPCRLKVPVTVTRTHPFDMPSPESPESHGGRTLARSGQTNQSGAPIIQGHMQGSPPRPVLPFPPQRPPSPFQSLNPHPGRRPRGEAAILGPGPSSPACSPPPMCGQLHELAIGRQVRGGAISSSLSTSRKVHIRGLQI